MFAFIFLSFSHSLSAIAKHFKFGRQEDAHEFLRYFVDALQRAALHQFPAKYAVGRGIVSHTLLSHATLLLSQYLQAGSVLQAYNSHTPNIWRVPQKSRYSCIYMYILREGGRGFPVHVVVMLLVCDSPFIST